MATSYALNQDSYILQKKKRFCIWCVGFLIVMEGLENVFQFSNDPIVCI